MGLQYNQYSDEHLIEILKRGDPQALGTIYNRYWKKLFVVSVNLIGTSEEAEECVQNVFISLWNRREKICLTHTLQTYLSVSVKYQAFSLIKASQKRKDLLVFQRAEQSTSFVTPEIELIAKELSVLIENSINRLPDQCQIVFRKSKEQGLTVKQIAEELNISQNTVKMHLKIANRKLKDDLLVVLPFIMSYMMK